MHYIKKKFQNNRYIYFSFLLVITLPGFLSTFGFATSHRNGLIISLFSILFFMFKKKIFINVFLFKSIIFFLFFILISFTITYLLNYQEVNIYSGVMPRFLGSLLLIIYVFFCAILFEDTLNSLGDYHFRKLISSLYKFLIFLGIFSFPFYYFDMLWKKHLFFFSEPSHYAIVLAPFYFYEIFNSKYRFAHILIMIILGFVWENLTLLVISMAGMLLVYNPRNYFFKSTFISLLLIIFIFYFAENIPFINERINFSVESKNLSILTLLSGYERAYLSIMETNGVGFGFQQMGMVGLVGSIQENIKNIAGDYMNLFDGSSLAPKIVFEFGFFGIIFIIIYLIYFIKVLRRIFNYQFESQKELFYSLIFISFTILLFVRAASYFTPSFFIFCVALIGLNRFFKYYRRSNNKTLI